MHSAAFDTSFRGDSTFESQVNYVAMQYQIKFNYVALIQKKRLKALQKPAVDKYEHPLILTLKQGR